MCGQQGSHLPSKIQQSHGGARKNLREEVLSDPSVCHWIIGGLEDLFIGFLFVCARFHVAQASFDDLELLIFLVPPPKCWITGLHHHAVLCGAMLCSAVWCCALLCGTMWCYVVLGIKPWGSYMLSKHSTTELYSLCCFFLGGVFCFIEAGP